MKKILTIVFAIASLSLAQGQFVMNTHVKHVSGSPNEFALKSTSYVKNIGSTAADFTWASRRLSIAPGWASATCDKITCYDTGVYTSDFTLTSGDSGIISVYMYPNGLNGTGSVEVTITMAGDTNEIIDTFYFETWALSVEDIHQDETVIFPNPVSKELNIHSDNVTTLSLYDIAGRLLVQQDHTNRSKINMALLPMGIYYLKCTDGAGNLTTRKIKKL